MARKVTGPVSGGVDFAHVPSFSGQYNELEPHARGRVRAMTEIAIHAACLKSLGLIPELAPSCSGAKFQDFRPVPGSNLVRAHRAIFSLDIGHQNLAHFPFNLTRPFLRKLLIGPQAATDPLPAVANYADRQLEIAAAVPILKLIENLLRRQRSGEPLEVNALMDIIPDIQKQLELAHGRAIEKCEDTLKRRGFSELQIKQELLNSGPTSELVEEQLDLTLAKGGPSQFLDHPQIILAASMDVTHQVAHVSRDEVETIADRAEEAATTVVSEGRGGG